MSNLRAIFAVDPGGTTGVAWGIFDIRADTVVEAMRGRREAGSASVFNERVEKGDIASIVRWQMEEIRGLYEDFVDIYMPHFHRDGVELDFVAEHFVLTGNRHKPGVEGIVPAFLLGAMFEMFAEEDIILQTAGEGMKWHTRDFHTKYNTWVRGREHEREAWAHVAARVHRVIR